MDSAKVKMRTEEVEELETAVGREVWKLGLAAAWCTHTHRLLSQSFAFARQLSPGGLHSAAQGIGDQNYIVL